MNKLCVKIIQGLLRICNITDHISIFVCLCQVIRSTDQFFKLYSSHFVAFFYFNCLYIADAVLFIRIGEQRHIIGRTVGSINLRSRFIVRWIVVIVIAYFDRNGPCRAGGLFPVFEGQNAILCIFASLRQHQRNIAIFIPGNGNHSFREICKLISASCL